MASDQPLSSGSQKPSKAADRNRIQNFFLDNKRVVQFYRHVYTHTHPFQYSKSLIRYFENEVEEASCNQTIFEGYYKWNVVLDGGNVGYSKHKHECHHDNCDKSCYYEGDSEEYDIPTTYINIALFVGDDYPSILRDMKTQIERTEKKMDKDKKDELKRETEEAHSTGKCKYLRWLENDCKRYCGRYYLLIKDYQSSTTKEELVHIFKQARIYVLFLHDVFADIPLSSSIQMTPSSSSETRTDLLEKRVARLESLLATMGIIVE
jgi:hypothetical protein